VSAEVFLSHAHADKAALQDLRRALELKGVACFEDVPDALRPPGAD
jgi:hypothetical protein